MVIDTKKSMKENERKKCFNENVCWWNVHGSMNECQRSDAEWNVMRDSAGFLWTNKSFEYCKSYQSIYAGIRVSIKLNNARKSAWKSVKCTLVNIVQWQQTHVI